MFQWTTGVESKMAFKCLILSFRHRVTDGLIRLTNAFGDQVGFGGLDIGVEETADHDGTRLLSLLLCSMCTNTRV